MNSFGQQKFTTVKNISDRRRMPRIAKIRLGGKVSSKGKEYPIELPFFLLPEDVARVYGFKTADEAVKRAEELRVTRKDVMQFITQNYYRLAEQLEIMFPVNYEAAVFPQALKYYGSGKGLKCIGNGETARDYEKQEDKECPCERLKSDINPKGECTLGGNLFVMLYKISLGGVYQIDTGSFNSTVDVNSAFLWASEWFGRFNKIPMILWREPYDTHHGGQKQTHWMVRCEVDERIYKGQDGMIDLEKVNRLAQDTKKIISESQYLLPSPENVNPITETAPDMFIEGTIEAEFKEGVETTTEHDNFPQSVVDQNTDHKNELNHASSSTPKSSVFDTLVITMKDCQTLDALVAVYKLVDANKKNLNKEQIKHLTTLKDQIKLEISNKNNSPLNQNKPIDTDSLKKQIEQYRGMISESEYLEIVGDKQINNLSTEELQDMFYVLQGKAMGVS